MPDHADEIAREIGDKWQYVLMDDVRHAISRDIAAALRAYADEKLEEAQARLDRPQDRAILEEVRQSLKFQPEAQEKP